MILVKCSVCGKIEHVSPSRAKNYKTCSYVCSGISNRSKPNFVCCICGKHAYKKKFRIDRLKNKDQMVCSRKCSDELKKTIYLGDKNPNYRYGKDEDFFKCIDSDQKAYLLGWIASDGSITRDAITIEIHDRDEEILHILGGIVSRDIPIVKCKENNVRISFYSVTMSSDVCQWLDIPYGKKSHTVGFPDLKSNELKWAFLRGLFDGDGSIRKKKDNRRTPECSICSSSVRMLDSICELCESYDIIYTKYQDTLSWCGKDASIFLDEMYKDKSFRMRRKYELYQDYISWTKTLVTSPQYKNDHCTWSKTRTDAITLTENNNGGYNLTILEKIKDVGDIELYDTGIKIKTREGVYFDLVPLDELNLYGYKLHENFEPIDGDNLCSVLVPLVKINDNEKCDISGLNLVKIIPRKIYQAEWVNVGSQEALGETERGTGGFGHTGVK